MIRLKIAWRNVFRNRSRSFLSVLMIAGSVIGIISFRGFSSHILHMLKTTTIDNQYNHIQVASQATWDVSPGKRERQFLANPVGLVDRLKALPEVTMVSSRLSFFGLISNGETTMSAKGIGYDPALETQFQKSLAIESGSALKSSSGHEVIIGAGLQKQLQIGVGQTLTVIAYTLDGVVNAMDLTVAGIFRVGTEDIDAHVFMLPLKTAQAVLDTESVETVTLRLKETELTAAVLPKVDGIARDYRSDAKARTWYDLAEHYRQIERFYAFQNHIVEIILVTLVILSIMNSVGMSVFERTGEIGTVRALGETPATVVTQFLLEGCLLGFLGVAVGWLGGVAVSFTVDALDLTMHLPGASFPVPIKIELQAEAFLIAASIGLLASVISTLLPSIRASKISIVDALRRNI